jgi:hypothetical protein
VPDGYEAGWTPEAMEKRKLVACLYSKQDHKARGPSLYRLSCPDSSATNGLAIIHREVF